MAQQPSMQYGGEMSANHVYFVLGQEGFNVRGNEGERLLREYGAKEVKTMGLTQEGERIDLMISVADVKRLLEDLRTGKLKVQNSGLAQRTQ